MKKKLHYDFKDLFLSARIAFSLQRIWVNGLGLFGGYLIYVILSYLSFIIAGYDFSLAWQRFGLLPCAFAMPVPWYAWLVYALGAIIFILVILMTNTAVSRLSYMVLRDELFYTWTQAFKFAFKKWISILGALITFIFIIAFFVVGALVMGLIGRIPFVGELGTALLTIPYILGGLLLFFVSLAFGVGLFFIPAIIATSDEDALGGVFQSFSITYNQPWRILVYGAIVSILEFVGIFLFAGAIKVAFKIVLWLFSSGMGDKFILMKNQALYVIDKALAPAYGYIHFFFGDIANFFYLTHRHAELAGLSATVNISAYIFAIFMLIVGGAVLAYGEAICNAGLTIIYVILYKKHENENLLEREDEELKEEEEETEETEEKPEAEPEQSSEEPGETDTGDEQKTE